MDNPILKITITAAASLIAVIYSWIIAGIDGITLALFAIAISPWIGGIVKNIEIPGVVKLELRGSKKAGNSYFKKFKTAQGKKLKPVQKHEYVFQSFLKDDVYALLSQFESEIKEWLNDLAKNEGIVVDGKSVGSLANSLKLAGVLSHDEYEAVKDLAQLLRRKIYSKEAVTDWVMRFGPHVIRMREDRLGTHIIPRLIEDWKNRDGAAGAETGMRLSKYFVQSPNAFLEAMSRNPEEFQDWLNEMENHTFTIHESSDELNELEDDLHLAYYKKLKQLILEAAKSSSDTKHGNLAKQIEAVVDSIAVTRIW